MPTGIYTANNRLVPALVLLLTLVFAMPADAEYYYQYRDDQGNIHITDDLGQVPEVKRSEVELHRSMPPTASDSQRNAARGRGSAFQQREAPGSGSWEMNLRREIESLEREQASLRRRFEDIQSEKNALGEPPSSSASRSEKQSYEAEVKSLNRKIEAYEKRRKSFDEKVTVLRSGRVE